MLYVHITAAGLFVSSSETHGTKNFPICHVSFQVPPKRQLQSTSKRYWNEKNYVLSMYSRCVCVVEILAWLMRSSRSLCEHAVLSCCSHVSLLKPPPCLIKVKTHDSHLIQSTSFDPFPMQRPIPQSTPRSSC